MGGGRSGGPGTKESQLKQETPEMRTTWKMACVLGMTLGLLTATQAMGQVKQPGQEDRLGQKQADQKKICLASKVTGMTVKDQSNQQCGKIQDLVIDESGQVQYLAISTEASATGSEKPARTPGQQPGQAGADVNAKLTLVPFEAAEFHEGEISSQNYVSLKNIDKDKLAQAPTFTAEQLASQSQQAQWMAEVDRFYDRQKSGAARPDLKDEKPDENRDRQE